MTMRFYPIEKKRNIQCLQCGDQVRRVYVDVNRNARCEEIINSLTRMGFTKNPEMEPTLTTMDFNDINMRIYNDGTAVAFETSEEFDDFKMHPSKFESLRELGFNFNPDFGELQFPQISSLAIRKQIKGTQQTSQRQRFIIFFLYHMYCIFPLIPCYGVRLNWVYNI